MRHVIILECETIKPVKDLEELVAQRLHTIDGVDPMKSVTILTQAQYEQKYIQSSPWDGDGAKIAAQAAQGK